MRRRELVAKVQARARLRGREWSLDRRGGRHDLWRCGQTVVTIPRHREINELTALGILKSLQQELGENWWR
jgi:mRNA interferase HicA